MTINLFVGAVAMALGAFVTALPYRAAEIWGSQKLSGLEPKRKTTLVRYYRAFGILLWLAGALFAAESGLFSRLGH